MYLVPCGFYAIMLSILIYCLFFLKYVFTIAITTTIIITITINITINIIMMVPRSKEWKNPTPNVAPTSYQRKSGL